MREREREREDKSREKDGPRDTLVTMDLVAAFLEPK